MIYNKIIEPSILALLDDKKEDILSKLNFLKQNGYQYIHYDVIDNIFTPGKSFTTEYIDKCRELGLLVNVHLMVDNHLIWIKKYINLDVNMIIFHPDNLSLEEINDFIDLIHNQNIKVGIAIKIDHDLNKYISLAKKIDYLLIMSVIPGRCNQIFNDLSKLNLQKAQKFIYINPNITIAMDGGINIELINDLKKFVNHFIMGSFFFKNMDLFKK